MIDSRRETGERGLAALERALTAATFLVGEGLTIADIAVYAYTHRAEDCGFKLASYPALSVWLGRIAKKIGPGYPVPPYSADAMVAST
jgi:glutathione S-transferase